MTYTHLPPAELRQYLTSYREQLIAYLHEGKIEAFATPVFRRNVVQYVPKIDLLRYELPLPNSAQIRILKEIHRIDILLDGRLSISLKNMINQLQNPT